MKSDFLCRIRQVGLGEWIVHQPSEASQDKTKVFISVNSGQVIDEEVVLTNTVLR